MIALERDKSWYEMLRAIVPANVELHHISMESEAKSLADVAANVAIPTAGLPNGIICGYWDDLNAAPTGGGSIKYQTVGVAPNRRDMNRHFPVRQYTDDAFPYANGPRSQSEHPHPVRGQL